MQFVKRILSQSIAVRGCFFATGCKECIFTEYFKKYLKINGGVCYNGDKVYAAPAATNLAFRKNTMENFDYIRKNCDELLSHLDLLQKKVGRRVELVAVTKSGTDDEVVALARYLSERGTVRIGENRPQMLKSRGELLKAAGIDAELHEIGNLQKNKVRMIIDEVALIHSVDSLELAAEISKRASASGRCVPVLIEVNSAKEESKGGVLPEEAEALYDELLALDGIRVAGVMTMGPVVDDPEKIRPYFRLTKELSDRLNAKHPFLGDEGGILSMGMSDSYAVAIEEGATVVRVGSRLFEK